MNKMKFKDKKFNVLKLLFDKVNCIISIIFCQ